MPGNALSRQLLELVRSTVPTYSAAVLLVFVARTPGRAWRILEVVEAMRPTSLTSAAIQEYVVHFASAGLLRLEPDGSFAFDPLTDRMRDAVADLTRAYDERPVTLIRTIYAMDHTLPTALEAAERRWLRASRPRRPD